MTTNENISQADAKRIAKAASYSDDSLAIALRFAERTAAEKGAGRGQKFWAKCLRAEATRRGL